MNRIRLLAAAVLAAAGTASGATPRFADCGAAGDGVTDDTAAFVRFFEASRAAGCRKVTIDPGVYRLAGETSVPLYGDCLVVAEGAEFRFPEDLGAKRRRVMFKGTDLRNFRWRGGFFRGYVYDPDAKENTWEPNASSRGIVIETTAEGRTDGVSISGVGGEGLSGAAVSVYGWLRGGVTNRAVNIDVRDCSLVRCGNFMWDYGFLWERRTHPGLFAPEQVALAEKYDDADAPVEQTFWRWGPRGIGPGKGGIDICRAANVIVSGCRLNACGDAMHVAESHHVVFSGNQITGARMGAFFIAHFCKDVTVTGNTVDGANGSRVMSVEKSTEDVTIVGNTFRNGGRGSWINQPKNIIIANNIFCENTGKCTPETGVGRRTHHPGGGFEKYPELYFTTYRPGAEYGPVVLRGNIFTLSPHASLAVAFRNGGRGIVFEDNVFRGAVKDVYVGPHCEMPRMGGNTGLGGVIREIGDRQSGGGLPEEEWETPVDITVGRQLFVDDFLVSATQGVVRVFNHPVKAFDAPVLWPETDLEREVDPARPHRLAPVAGATSGGLWWDPVKRRFRLWYEAGWMKHLCYAESADGRTWERGDRGVVAGTNRVLTDALVDSWSVFPDYAADDPYANWRLMVSLAGDVTDNRLYTSADGLAWTHIGNAGQSGDRSTMFYDPFRRVWVFSLRGGGPGTGGRNRSFWSSPTFGGDACRWNFPERNGPGLHPDWPRPKPWLATDGRDAPDAAVGGLRPQLYNVDAVAYESLMLGMFEILHPMKGDNTACAKAGLPKITDLHFAYSRDGWRYDRPDRTAAIPASRWGSGKWDTGYLSPMGGLCVIQDERLWFYYTAVRGDATETTPYSRDPDVGWRRNGMHFNASVGVATLRRDGFAGLVADGRGTVTTKPLTFAGRRLFVNAECRFGSLAADVLDAAGNVLPGFAAADCRALERTDTVKAELRWRGGDLAATAGRPVRFRFRLHCGTLYSFWVSADETGKSGGWLAAGGPDYKGLRDL